MTIPLVGYADRFSVAPGESIAFKVSSALAGPYRARLVRVVCGDPNPAGPGIKERTVEADFAGRYPSRMQPVHLGSCAIVDDPRTALVLAGRTGLGVEAHIWPTLPAEPGQTIVSWLAAGPSPRSGLALVLDGQQGVSAVVGTPAGPVTVSVGKRLRTRSWYRVWAAVDVVGAASSWVTVGQQPLAPAFGVDDAGTRTQDVPGTALESPGPITIAARAGHGQASGPFAGHFNGKIERPRVGPPAGAGDPAAGSGAGNESWAEWDFARATTTQTIVDVGPHGLDGRLVNLPARAMTGATWTGEEHCWRHRPEHYGAIHFHDDDLYDCGWETDFTFTVPPGFPSGPYAVRLEGEGHSEMIPFYVRPPRGPSVGRPAICVLVPTFTYVVYGNYSRQVSDDAYRARVAAWGARPWNPDDHPQFGLSTYNFHRDGSGIGYVSRLRPMITMRSGFLSYVDARGSGLRHYPADTHLFDWLDAKGHAFDVITDEDLDEEGADLVAPYRVVLTTSHPEYHTAATLDALEAYRDRGGRLMYLGGNGFYWRVARHPDVPGAIEVRRAEGGIRAWAAEPGEYYHAFDGSYGGLWRRNGRPPQRLAGVGFTAQGMFEGTYYERAPGADDPRAAWILEGVEDRRLGDFGLSGGGAAGFELDRLDHRLGSPANAIVIARSVDHPTHFVLVPEELLTHITTWPGEPPEALIRADMVYFETDNGGAVFSVGSITFCGSLCHHEYDNPISRIVANVLERFSR